MTDSQDNHRSIERLERVRLDRDKWTEEQRQARIQPPTNTITWKHGQSKGESYYEISGNSNYLDEISDRENDWSKTLHGFITPPSSNTWIFYFSYTCYGGLLGSLITYLWQFSQYRNVLILFLGVFLIAGIATYHEASRYAPKSRLIILLAAFIGGIGLGILAIL